jgi:uncharacterized NAD-dependent epimerase/dehydratase family protein
MQWDMNERQLARYLELRDEAVMRGMDVVNAAYWLIAAPEWSAFARRHLTHSMSLPRARVSDAMRLAEILSLGSGAGMRRRMVELRHIKRALSMVRAMIRAARDVRPRKKSIWA